MKVAKNHELYFCEICDYFTSRKYNYNKHLSSNKHCYKIATKSSNFKQDLQKPHEYTCEKCATFCSTRAGIWKHRKKCNGTLNNKEIDKDILIMMLIQQNASLMNDHNNIKEILLEQQKQNNIMMEINKQNLSAINNNITNNLKNNLTNNINVNNKSFNLNLFLNDMCKNAMNLTEFIESIKLQLNDLINVGELGYIEGISNIIIQNLNAMDITERPIHCTDKKRETLYIRDENKWEKDDFKNNKIRKIIKTLSGKNIKLLPQYREKYPDYSISTSKKSDEYNKLVMEAMGGHGDNTLEKENKIIKNIVNATYLTDNIKKNSIVTAV